MNRVCGMNEGHQSVTERRASRHSRPPIAREILLCVRKNRAKKKKPGGQEPYDGPGRGIVAAIETREAGVTSLIERKRKRSSTRR